METLAWLDQKHKEGVRDFKQFKLSPTQKKVITHAVLTVGTPRQFVQLLSLLFQEFENFKQKAPDIDWLRRPKNRGREHLQFIIDTLVSQDRLEEFIALNEYLQTKSNTTSEGYSLPWIYLLRYVSQFGELGPKFYSYMQSEEIETLLTTYLTKEWIEITQKCRDPQSCFEVFQKMLDILFTDRKLKQVLDKEPTIVSSYLLSTIQSITEAKTALPKSREPLPKVDGENLSLIAGFLDVQKSIDDVNWPIIIELLTQPIQSCDPFAAKKEDRAVTMLQLALEKYQKEKNISPLKQWLSEYYDTFSCHASLRNAVILVGSLIAAYTFYQLISSDASLLSDVSQYFTQLQEYLTSYFSSQEQRDKTGSPETKFEPWIQDIIDMYAKNVSNPFQVLPVSDYPTKRAVKKAVRQVLSNLHPDKITSFLSSTGIQIDPTEFAQWFNPLAEKRM